MPKGIQKMTRQFIKENLLNSVRTTRIHASEPWLYPLLSLGNVANVGCPLSQASSWGLCYFPGTVSCISATSSWIQKRTNWRQVHPRVLCLLFYSCLLIKGRLDLEYLGPHHPHPSSFMGWEFHDGRDKQSRLEVTTQAQYPTSKAKTSLRKKHATVLSTCSKRLQRETGLFISQCGKVNSGHSLANTTNN